MNTYSNHHAQLFDLSVKFLTGEITVAEQEQLHALLKEPENKNIFQELKDNWIASGNYILEEKNKTTDQQWHTIRQSLSTNQSIPEEEETRNYFSFYLKIAAAALLLISMGSAVTWLIMRRAAFPTNQYCVIQTPLGSKMKMELQDGTVVWLNAGSSLRYPSNFTTRQRDVYLSGEAFFKVASNKAWPFIVHTQELNVRAVGTSFNVKAYPGEKKVTTTLLEGIVKLENDRRKFNYTLKPNQELVYHKEITAENTKTIQSVKPSETSTVQNPIPSEQVVIKNVTNTEEVVSWKEKRWMIHGESIENLTVMLERRYNIKINVLSRELNAYKFSGTIENETIEQVMDYLRYTVPMKYNINKGYIDLKIDNQLKERYRSYLKN